MARFVSATAIAALGVPVAVASATGVEAASGAAGDEEPSSSTPRISKKYMRACYVAVAALPVAFVLAAAASPAPLAPVVGSPTTLVATSNIETFAQDGGYIGWTAGDCPKVRVRLAAGGTTATLADTDGGDACYLLDAFAIAGPRAVWGGFEDCCNHGYGEVATAAPGQRRKQLRGLSQDYHTWGDFLTGASGDGRTLVFSVATISLTKSLDTSRGFLHCLPSDPCTWQIRGGGVWRVVGRSAVPLKGAPPTALVAASAQRVALVPADPAVFDGPCSNDTGFNGCPEARAAIGARVEVRNVSTGAITSSFTPKGRVVALALDGSTVAVLVRAGRTARIERYVTETGAFRAQTAVPARIADEVDLAQPWIVFHVGRSISLLNLSTGRIVVIARAHGNPIGLSIEHARVAWAENIKDNGFIRQIMIR